VKKSFAMLGTRQMDIGNENWSKPVLSTQSKAPGFFLLLVFWFSPPEVSKVQFNILKGERKTGCISLCLSLR